MVYDNFTILNLCVLNLMIFIFFYYYYFSSGNSIVFKININIIV